MLLNYLYANFLEESLFADACNLSVNELNALIEKKLCPKPSYLYQSSGMSKSFVSECQQNENYRFHLKGHVVWAQALKRFGIETEERARRYFETRYDEAMALFFTSQLGTELSELVPTIAAKFNDGMKTTTWQHFLNGVYGVCTRDGQPETIFLKQAGVMFIDQMATCSPNEISETSLALLAKTVAFLDSVEAEFAPGEVVNTSRQRCIIDVQSDFFIQIAAQ